MCLKTPNKQTSLFGTGLIKAMKVKYKYSGTWLVCFTRKQLYVSLYSQMLSKNVLADDSILSFN
jgi:hypothetical protein